MKEIKYVPDPLNEQASILVDAQTDIKTAVKQGVLAGNTAEAIKKKLAAIIESAVARIRSPTLKLDARKSLMLFANKVYGDFSSTVRIIPSPMLPAVIVLMRAISEKQPKGEYYMPATNAERQAAQQLYYKVTNMGVPLQEFNKVYMSRVQTALDNLAEAKALDPNDFTRRNSLRNLAEMQVRYERHQDEIRGFRERGTRLVVCSAHADCSSRCAKWQGRVYSMDGTEGYTEDGRHYVPLETATQNTADQYTTKAGRVYQNGLLGFNCRHKLTEFKVGMAVPYLSADERKKQYAITLRQREMEREVIAAREKALSYKGIKPKEYSKWAKIAVERNKAYEQFSKENSRAFYRDRVKII